MATVKEKQRLTSTARMLEAALNLFAREGYTKASMSRIAEKAGMVKGSLSIRFGTKEKLFNAVQSMIWGKVQFIAENAGTAEVFIRDWLDYLRTEEASDSDLYLFIQSFHRGNDLPPNAAEYAAGLFKDSPMEHAVEQCIRDGKLPEGEPGEVYLRLNRFVIGTFWNYRTCSMKLPSDETILNGLWDRSVPKATGSDNTGDSLQNIGIRAVLSDYDLIIYVDVQVISSEDRVYPIFIRPDFEILCPGLRDEKYAFNFYNRLSQTLIPPEEQYPFMNSLRRKKVLEVLTDEGKMIFRFPILDHGQIRHYQMNLYVDFARDGTLRGYTAGIRNCDENYRLSIQASNSRRIIDVLARQYTSLYHVDAVTGQMTSYTSDEQITSAFLKHNNTVMDYDTAVREFGEMYVPDRRIIEDCLLKNVLIRLETETSFEHFFRFSDGWQHHYGRVRFTRTGTNEQGDYGFVVTLDMEDERVLSHYVSRSLEEEYVAIYFIDLKHEIVRSYRQSADTAIALFNSMPLNKVAKLFAAEVKPAYRKQFEAFANPKNIIDFIGVEERREYNYELLGTVGSWRRCVWQITEWSDGQPSGVLVSFITLDDESVRRMQLDNDISDTLSGLYDNILCVDLDENRFLYSRLDERYFAFFGQMPENGMRFTEFAETYARHFIHENDRERILGICNPENLRAAFSRRKNISVTFLSSYTGVFRYHEMSFTRMPDEFGHIRFIWALVDADDQVRYEMKRTADLQKRNIALNRISEEIIDLLGNLTEARDIQSGEHIRRVKGFTRILAQQVMRDWPEYGLTGEQIELMTSASALHDLGKISIPDAILLKNAPLTQVERKIMETHCEKGCEILSKAPKDWSEAYLKMSMDICRYHHEKYDGTGYPMGLKGDEIPLEAKIMAIADVYDALVSERCYKQPISHEEAYKIIEDSMGTHFDPKLRHCFEIAYPSLVKFYGESA